MKHLFILILIFTITLCMSQDVHRATFQVISDTSYVAFTEVEIITPDSSYTLICNSKGQLGLNIDSTTYKLTFKHPSYYSKTIYLSRCHIKECKLKAEGLCDMYRLGTTSGSENKYDGFICLKPIIIHEVFTYRNILYDYDEFYIRENAKPSLDSIATFILDNPGLEVELTSHTDRRGSNQYNLILSQNRAAAAYKYLLYKGVNSNSLTYSGKGETQLLNPCVKCSEEEHQSNRRTEIRIMKYTPEGYLKAEDYKNQNRVITIKKN